MSSLDDKGGLTEQEIESAIHEIQALTPAQRGKVLGVLADLGAKPEPRMKKTMAYVAATVGLEWRDDSPANHPYGARLDGRLYLGTKLVADVELQARTPKQIRGALLDLIAYPEGTKILVIGNSKAVRVSEAKSAMIDRVIPVIRNLMSNTPDLAVFTEHELKDNPKCLTDYLGLPEMLPRQEAAG